MPSGTSEVVSKPISQLPTEVGDVMEHDHDSAPAVNTWIVTAEERLGYRFEEITTRVVSPAANPFQDRIDEMKSRWAGVSETEFAVWADVVAEDDRAAEQASAETWPAD